MKITPVDFISVYGPIHVAGTRTLSMIPTESPFAIAVREERSYRRTAPAGYIAHTVEVEPLESADLVDGVRKFIF